MIDKSALWDRVRAFAAEQTDARAERLTPATTLFGDLGVDGDDADELFAAFATEFGVDLSGLDLSRHFGPEAWPPWALLILPLWMLWMARPGEPHKKAGVIPITLGDLLRSAEAGRWVGPQPSPDAAKPLQAERPGRSLTK
jgi:acyl carrier protein